MRKSCFSNACAIGRHTDAIGRHTDGVECNETNVRKIRSHVLRYVAYWIYLMGTCSPIMLWFLLVNNYSRADSNGRVEEDEVVQIGFAMSL